MGILVIDVGTSSLRAVVVDGDSQIVAEERRESLPATPAPGLVEFDAAALAALALDAATAVLGRAGPVDAVGITNQRGSTVVWDRATGRPVAPAQGWQDLRTIGECLVLGAEGFRLAPNQSATKLADILGNVDPDRERDLCFGTVDSWLVWVLSQGDAHVTDLSNAAITGLVDHQATGWDGAVLERLAIPPASLPRIVDSVGVAAVASALPGAPPVAGIAGDQQASLVGQGCVRSGMAKATFGTGGMLDVCLDARPAHQGRGGHGTFPIVCWRDGGGTRWGAEAVMLSAGTNIEWLRDDLGILGSAAESATVAAACETTDGVIYVPALLGLGTPHWDYGARGALLGITRGTGRAEVVRAVLEGVAHRGADLLEATEADTGAAVPVLRVDGGMSANPVFTQALADATGRPVEISREPEATSLGAAFLAGMAVGTWGGWDDVAASWAPSAVVEPASTPDRDRWHEAVERARRWHPDLSSIDF